MGGLFGRKRRDLGAVNGVDLGELDAAVNGVGGDCLKRAFCQTVFDTKNDENSG